MNFQPVILGGGPNAYSVARSIYEFVPVISKVFDFKHSITTYSRFTNFEFCLDPRKNERDFLSKVLKAGKCIVDSGKTSILIACNDHHLIPAAVNHSSLAELFLMTFPDWTVMGKYLQKKSLYEMAEKAAVAYHRSVSVSSDFTGNGFDLETPILIKPSIRTEFEKFSDLIQRNHIFQSLQAGAEFVKACFDQGYSGDFIVQEFIPGGSENLFTISSFSDRNFEIKGVSIGHKLTQFPPNAGTITSGHVIFDEKLIEPTQHLLEAGGFYGIANIEYKYDSRVNAYKLIEVNPRPGMWNYSCTASGVNLFEMLIKDFYLKEPVSYQDGRKELIWSVIGQSELREKVPESYKDKLLTLPIVNPVKLEVEAVSVKFFLFYENLKKKVSMYLLGRALIRFKRLIYEKLIRLSKRNLNGKNLFIRVVLAGRTIEKN